MTAPAAAAPADEAPVPEMSLPQLKFQIQQGIQTEASKAELLEGVKKYEMAPYYTQLCSDLKWPVDKPLLSQLQQKNQEELSKLEAKLTDARANFGESEVFECLKAIAHFHVRIGDKQSALKALETALEKAVGAGMKLDIVFVQLRVHLFHNDDVAATERCIAQAKALIDEGGDWDRRNRLKVYQGLFLMSQRQFKQATPMMLDGLPTFTCTELMPYRDFVRYTVIAALMCIERGELKTKVIESPEILEVLHEIPHLEEFVSSLYTCKYGLFFRSLSSIEAYLKNDRFLNAHYNWYTREMRILAYKQILESYQSLTLASMAKHFGVTADFIDRDLSKFIANGRLHCVIDKVAGVVETNRPDNKNAQYQECIKQGDILLNRIQKLGRVINV
eukprot:Partr_v1_DN28123_c1_g1_i1_m55361 putative Proteasome (Prosome, macropain) 26S subunit, non-ATPase, 6